MKRDGFLFVVIAFAIFSAFILYLDYSKDCGSVVCFAEYVSTGEVSPKVYDLGDSFISELIYPFINPVSESPLFQPSGPIIDEVIPNTIQSVESVIEVFGSGFKTDFGIAMRPAGEVDWVPICTNTVFGPPGCTFGDENRVSFILPAIPVAEYELQFVDLTDVISGSGPPIESNIVPFTVEPSLGSVPTSPTGLIVTSISSDSLQIDWTDNSIDETGFSIERSILGENNFVNVGNVGADIETFTDTLLTPNTYYEYRVFAFNGAGNSPYSNIASGRTLHLTPTISSTSPQNLYQGTPVTVTVTGTNFVPEFGIRIRPVTIPASPWTDWCAAAPGFPQTWCNYVSDTQVTFDIPSPVAADYEIAYVNIFGVVYSAGPEIMSSAFPLVVQPPIIPPTITSVDPNLVRHNIARTITVSGTNFDPQFVLVYRIQGTSQEVPYCSFLDTSLCTWVDSSTLQVNLPQGIPAEVYELAYYNLNPSIVGSNFVPVTVQATTCLDGLETAPCANQNGVCAGSIAQCVDGEFEVCTAATYQTHAEGNGDVYSTSEVGLCTDGDDNDCTLEFDHLGTADGVVKGDQDCAISIISVGVPSTAVLGSNLNLVCTTDVPNVAVAVDGLLNEVFCPQSTSSGNNVNFNCLVSGTPGTSQTATCQIDSSIAYDSGLPVTSGAIQILASSCSGYSSSSTCELDNNCDWALACSGQQSSGAGDRCVPTGSASYSCISGQCGATWTAGNSCGPDEIPNTNSCSCVSQAPVVTDINGLPTVNLPWGSDNSITLNGQYFASDAQVFIDGVSITNPLTVTSNSISFVVDAEQFAVGTHSLMVINPTTGLSSDSITFRFSSNPIINSVVPNVVYNNVNTIVNISGIDFDPDYLLLLNGIDVTFLTAYVNSGLIQFLVPPAEISGQFNLVVVSGDGLSSSNPVPFALNYPFDYLMGVNPSLVTVATGYTFQSQIDFLTLFDMTQEEIVVSVPDTPEATISFVGLDRCTPSGPAPYPTCSVTIEVSVGSVSEQQYTIPVFATSQSTGVAHQTTITMEGVIGTIADCTNGIQDSHETCQDGGGPICAPAGFLCSFGESCLLNNDCQVNPSCSPPMGLCYSSTVVPNPICSPDQDCDSVPDSVDTCPSTPAGTTVSQLNGCPLPVVTEFSSASTTNFASVTDLNNVPSMNLRVDGAGGILYVNPVSVLRLVSGVHQAINLNDAIQISNNLISVDSVNYPELSGLSTVSFEGLTFTDVTPMTRASSSGSFTVCPNTQCDDLTYNGGVFTMRVSGFSEYSTQQAQCGDSYCSLGENQNNCAADCGAPSSSGNPSGGGGGGGGGGGSSVRPPVVTATQCNDNIDNDGDGLIDYPADTGCFTLQDNSELDESPLIDNTSDGQPSNVDTPLEKAFEVRVVFWLVLILLIGGIVGVSTIILRDLMGRKKFNELAKMVNSSQQSQNVAISKGV